MKKVDTDLLCAIGTIGLIGGLGMLCKNLDGKEKLKKEKKKSESLEEILAEPASVMCDRVKPNSIYGDMEDLQYFDKQLIKMLTEMGYVVTHIYSEDRKAYHPFTMIGISADHIPEIFDRAEDLFVPECYDDLLDTDMVKEAVSKVISENFSYGKIKFSENPDMCLARIFGDLLDVSRVFIRNAPLSRKSIIGCAEIEFDNIDDDDDMRWKPARASKASDIDEIFIEMTYEALCSSKDLFNVVSVLLKMDLATIVERNSFNKEN